MPKPCRQPVERRIRIASNHPNDAPKKFPFPPRLIARAQRCAPNTRRVERYLAPVRSLEASDRPAHARPTLCITESGFRRPSPAFQLATAHGSRSRYIVVASIECCRHDCFLGPSPPSQPPTSVSTPLLKSTMGGTSLEVSTHIHRVIHRGTSNLLPVACRAGSRLGSTLFRVTTRLKPTPSHDHGGP